MVEAAASDSSFEEVIPAARHLASSAAHRARRRIADSSENSSVMESAQQSCKAFSSDADQCNCYSSS